MEEVPANRCGYTWPQEFHVDDAVSDTQTCCCRETLPDTDHCPWHADPDDTEAKTPEALRKTRVPAAIRSRTRPFSESLDGSMLKDVDLREVGSMAGVGLRNAELSMAELQNVDLTEANLENANLQHASLSGAELNRAKLNGANLDMADLSGVDLAWADLTNTSILYANLRRANLAAATLNEAKFGYYTDPKMDGETPTDMSHSSLQRADLIDVTMTQVDLSNANLERTNLSEASITESDFTDSNLQEAILSEASINKTDFTDSNLRGATLNEARLNASKFVRANLSSATLSDIKKTMQTQDSSVRIDFMKANLSGADLSEATLEQSDFTDASLSSANCTGANLEQANFTRTNLFDASLVNCRTHGATFTDSQINNSTALGSDKSDAIPRWKIWKRSSSSRCVYDPLCSSKASDTSADIGKAADTYRSYEKLARQNARSALQSAMFTLRQDMQRKRSWHDNDYSDWLFARTSCAVFRYGESLIRIVSSAVLLIVLYAAVYAKWNLIVNAEGNSIESVVDVLYFSTLTFTTLGLGDFKPEPTSEIARLLVTSQAAAGAILIAVFVFVLGRRAAR